MAQESAAVSQSAVRPMQGIRVLDVSSFLAGPFCATQLAEFGAEVIKIELPGVGDALRKFGTMTGAGVSLPWLQEARNKKSATLDLLSDGRLELGVGAGWMNTDYEQSGIPKEPAGVRIERLEEALDILDGLFADGPFDYQGQHYTITGLDGLPKPLQKPRPPLIIGGGGKRVLSLAARRADIVGIAPRATTGAVDAAAAATGTGPETDKKLAWVRDAAGDRYRDVEINVLLFAVLPTDDPGSMASMVSTVRMPRARRSAMTPSLCTVWPSVMVSRPSMADTRAWSIASRTP